MQTFFSTIVCPIFGALCYVAGTYAYDKYAAYKERKEHKS